MANDVVRSYIWIPILISFLACVASSEVDGDIRLPSQRYEDLLTSTCPAPDPDLYYRPVIGIVSHPGDGASGRLNNATGASYIAASYVKFVESGGARVIPFIYNDPWETILEKLDLVNGVLFTGGSDEGSGLYFKTIRRIFKKVLEKNDGGHHFPLYATCLGFEQITRIVSEDTNILEEFSALDQASTLQFIKDAPIDGTVFERFPRGLLKKLTTDCIVMQNHHLGISPGKFLGNEKLSSFFEVLTTTKDKNNKDYVSTVRSWNYPVTGFQWHPEKNSFEWASRNIPHTQDAIQVTQHVANFLDSEARKSRAIDHVKKKCWTISFTITFLLIVGRKGADLIKFISSIVISVSRRRSQQTLMSWIDSYIKYHYCWITTAQLYDFALGFSAVVAVHA